MYICDFTKRFLRESEFSTPPSDRVPKQLSKLSHRTDCVSPKARIP